VRNPAGFAAVHECVPMIRTPWFLCATLCFALPLGAAIPEQDFSGTWLLDRMAGNYRQLGPPDDALTIRQTDAAITCEAGATRWTFPLDGGERKFSVAGERWSAATKWEGSALLINSLVMGAHDYTVMDRWTLSRDLQSLTISRQILRGATQSEGLLVYRRPGVSAPAPATAPAPAPSTPVLIRRPESPAPSQPPAEREYVVPVGTRVLLSLVNTINTKHSRDGDRVYLETAFPVYVDGRTVIPRGATVTGTVSNAKRPGKVTGKGEIYIRFDELTLPNGVSRDFRSRLGSVDGGSGELDRKEGSVKGEGGHGGDARTVATGAGIGATLGGAIGRSVGTAGIGGAAGAAAGLATVLMKRGPDPGLPRGTNVEMILDRDLHYRASELSYR
jgi:hypothetical protein